MIAWRLCTELADRIWERHEPELLERLLAEERDERCERHPWRRRPCAACSESENLELGFEDITPRSEAADRERDALGALRSPSHARRSRIVLDVGCIVGCHSLTVTDQLEKRSAE